MTTKKHAPRAAGDLDPGFGNGGTVTLNFQTASFNQVWSLALTPERRILVTGATVERNLIVVRLMEDGAWDTFFGIRGSAQFRFNGYPSVGRSVSVLDDGKILVVGTYVRDDQVLPAASRLHANGDLDTTFAEGGYFVFPPPTTPAEKISITEAISKRRASSSSSNLRSEVLPDGKILISHSMLDYGYGLLIRLTANGVLDVSFNGSGYTTVIFPREHAQRTFVSSAMGTPNGEILVGGQVNLGPTKGNKGMLARYGTDGRPDSSFGDDGSGFIMFAETTNSRVDDLVAGAENTFIGVGSMPVKHQHGEAIIFGRMANGAPDPDFNAGKITAFAYPVNTEWYSAAATPTTHSIVATGIAYNDNFQTEGVIVARYLQTGKLDTDFGGGKGWVRLEPGLEPRLTLQADGKMLICYPLYTPLTRVPVVTRLLN